jgi:hypothetical protein
LSTFAKLSAVLGSDFTNAIIYELTK